MFNILRNLFCKIKKQFCLINVLLITSTVTPLAMARISPPFLHRLCHVIKNMAGVQGAANNTNKKHLVVGPGCMAFGIGWWKDPISPEQEKKIVAHIDSTTNEHLEGLTQYVKDYSSRASIRKALMQKALSVEAGKSLTKEQCKLLDAIIGHLKLEFDQKQGKRSWWSGWFYRAPYVYDELIIFCIDQNNIEGMNYILSRKTNGPDGIERYLSPKVISKFEMYISNPCNIKYLVADLIKITNDLGLYESSLVWHSNKLYRYVMEKLLHNRDHIDYLYKDFFTKLFNEDKKDTLLSFIIESDNIKALLWCIEKYPVPVKVALERMEHPKIGKFSYDHVLEFPADYRFDLLRNKNVIEYAIGRLVGGDSNARMAFAIYPEHFYNNLSRASDAYQICFVEWVKGSEISQCDTIEEMCKLVEKMCDSVSTTVYFDNIMIFLFKVLRSPNNPCPHNSAFVCEQCQEINKQCKRAFWDLVIKKMNSPEVRMHPNYKKSVQEVIDVYFQNIEILKNTGSLQILKECVTHLDEADRKKIEEDLIKHGLS